MAQAVPGSTRPFSRVADLRLLRTHRRTVCAGGIQLDSGLLDTLSGFVQHAPLALERVVYPCSSMNCGDAVYRSTLDANLRMEDDGVNPITWLLIALSLVYLTATPGVLQGFVDTYINAPILRLMQPQLQPGDIKIGRQLAEGGFGTVYLGTSKKSLPGRIGRGQAIVVKKAIEFGEAEVWMNERLTRAAPQAIATYLGAYPDGQARVGTPLVLLWAFEGKMSLSDAMAARDFPFNVEQQLLGRELRISNPALRKLATCKVIVRQILENLAALHSTGIVHRDVKPQNMILSDTDGIKLIDLGAAADLRVGINYVPNEYLLDPRYAPPQQYVMSPLTPRAPPTPLAALLSPVLWRLNQPDRFDMYSVGIIMIQLVFPTLRNDNGLVAFNNKIESLEWDLEAWRASVERKNSKSKLSEGFEVLDAEGGAGWDLLKQLVAFGRYERCSAAEALRHPWLEDASKRSLGSGVGKELTRTVDGVLQQAVDQSALGKREVDALSEAELYKALNDDKKLEAPSRTMPRTIAWWQSRARYEEKGGGLLGKIFRQQPASGEVRRAAGAATQRAFGPAAGALSNRKSPSEKAPANGSRGDKVRDNAPRPPSSNGSASEAPQQQGAGLFSILDKLR